MSKQEETFNDGEVSLEALMGGTPLYELASGEDKKEKPEEKTIEEEIESSLIGEEEVSVEEPENEKLSDEEIEIESKQEKDKKKTETILEDTKSSAYQKAQTLMELGLLEDIRLSTSEDEEDEGIELSKMKDLTEEQLNFVLEKQQEKKEKEFQEKFISKENLNDHHLKLVEILKNGGDINEITANPNQYLVRPFEGFDLDDQKDQVKIAIQYYTQKGLEREDILRTVKGKLEDGKLSEFANNVNKAYQDWFDSNLEKKNQELIQKRQEEENKVQETRKALSSTLKEAKIKDTLTKKLVDGVTKKQEDGLRDIERKFKELLENPVENYETLLHILDPQSFKEIYKIKTNKKATEQVLRIASLTPKTSSKKNTTRKDPEFSDSYEKQIENLLIAGQNK